MSLTKKETFKQQPDATISQANPVSGTKYEWEDPDGNPLGTQKNVRIIGIELEITWETTQPNPLEAHATIDGQTVTFTIADAVSETEHFAKNSLAAEETAQVLVTTEPDVPFLREGRKVK
ncbi:unnamed protein product, partial [marine sediment metagenome]